MYYVCNSSAQGMYYLCAIRAITCFSLLLFLLLLSFVVVFNEPLIAMGLRVARNLAW